MRIFNFDGGTRAHSSQRQAGSQRRSQGFCLRPWVPLRRRDLRGHPRLLRKRLQAGGAHRPAAGFCPGHRSRAAARPRRLHPGDARDSRRQRDARRVHPTRRLTRSRRSRDRSRQVPRADGRHHRGHDRALPKGALRQGHLLDHCEHPAHSDGLPGPAHQVPELPQQHPRQARSTKRRLPGSRDAEPAGLRRRMHGRQPVHRQERHRQDSGAAPGSARRDHPRPP